VRFSAPGREQRIHRPPDPGVLRRIEVQQRGPPPHASAAVHGTQSRSRAKMGHARWIPYEARI
jgi:hypothetical protein